VTEVRGNGLATVTTTRVNQTQVIFHDYAGRRHELRYEVRCWTCNSPHLHEINELKVLGLSTQKILNKLGIQDDINVRNVDRHFVKHLPGVRSMVNGMNVVMAAAGALDDLIGAIKPEEVLRTIIEIGMSAMMNGEIRPTIAEVIQAAKAEKDLQRLGEAAISDAIYAEAITILCEAVRKEMSEDAFSRFMWQIRSHPRMRVILAQLDDMRTDAIPATARDSMVRIPDELLPCL
jgi:hypothetical protein